MPSVIWQGMLLLNLKKYKKTSKHAEVAKKRELFVKVLSGMEADQQLDGVDSIESYTRTWTQMIDRGGLYQVKDDVSIKGIFMILYNTLLTIIIISVSGLHTCGIN